MVFQTNVEYLQIQCNSIKDDNYIELSSTQIKKLQNTAKVKTLTTNKIALWIKAEVSRKKVDVHMRKVICIIS